MIALFSDSVVNASVDLEGAVKRVLARHWYVLGEEVASFEAEFAAYVGVGHCVTVANGTDALEIALRGIGVECGDKVVTVANAGFYSSTAIHAIGAIPVYVDVNPASLTMALDAVVSALVLRPKCVVVTHLYGQLADLSALQELTRDAGIPLIEDCAQSHGAHRDGRQGGSWGDAACFSFYPTKNLGALGDGGAVVTNNAQIAASLRSLRQYGWSAKYQVNTRGGRNSRLDEMQAAILREKLPYLDAWNGMRRHVASLYNTAFSELPVVSLPSIGEDYVAHLYVMRVNERDAFCKFLKSEGVATDIHYPIPDHRQAAYPNACQAGPMHVTDAASASVVSLPCFPGMTDSEVGQVIATVKAYYGQ